MDRESCDSYRELCDYMTIRGGGGCTRSFSNPVFT